MYGLMFNHRSHSTFSWQISDQISDSEALKMDLSQSDLRDKQEHMFMWTYQRFGKLSQKYKIFTSGVICSCSLHCQSDPLKLQVCGPDKADRITSNKYFKMYSNKFKFLLWPFLSLLIFNFTLNKYHVFRGFKV